MFSEQFLWDSGRVGWQPRRRCWRFYFQEHSTHLNVWEACARVSKCSRSTETVVPAGRLQSSFLSLSAVHRSVVPLARGRACGWLVVSLLMQGEGQLSTPAPLVPGPRLVHLALKRCKGLLFVIPPLGADSLPAFVTHLKPSCFWLLTAKHLVKSFMKLVTETVFCCPILLCINSFWPSWLVGQQRFLVFFLHTGTQRCYQWEPPVRSWAVCRTYAQQASQQGSRPRPHWDHGAHGVVINVALRILPSSIEKQLIAKCPKEW